MAALSGGAGHPAETEASQLLMRLTGRDPSAWNALVAAHGSGLYQVARRHGLAPADAEDVVQITWLRCLERVSTVREPSALACWLRATARNESLRRLHGLRRVIPRAHTDHDTSWEAAHEPAADVADIVVRRDEERCLWAAISDLPARQQGVLAALLHPDDEGYRQGAQSLGVPLGSLGPTRRRAIERLRRHPLLERAG